MKDDILGGEGGGEGGRWGFPKYWGPLSTVQIDWLLQATLYLSRAYDVALKHSILQGQKQQQEHRKRQEIQTLHNR